MGKRQEIEVPSLDIINEMRPDVPPTDSKQGRKEEEEAEGGNTQTTESVREQAVAPKRRARTERGMGKAKQAGNTVEEEDYLSLFIDTPPMQTVARHGKLAYLLPEYHNRIQRIIQIIGKNKVNISTYLNRIVALHFEQYDDVIRSLYEKSYYDEF